MAPGSSLRTEALDRIFQENAYKLLEESHITGAAAVVVRSGQRGTKQPPMVYMKGFGYEKLQSAKVLDVKTTLFNCGACSSILTALSIMQLWQDKEIDLHKDINEYLPSDIQIDNQASDPVTLHTLLTHTSGLREGGMLDEPKSDFTPTDTAAERLPKSYVARTAESLMPSSVHPPRQQHMHCSVNDVLTGVVVEEVSGMEYARYVSKKLLNPAGLSMGGIRSASTYEIDTEGYCIPKTILPEPLSPLGGLVVTPAEMAKLLLWLVQPLGTGLPGTSLLSETSLAAMQMNHFPIGKSGQGACYGFTNVKVGYTGCAVLLCAHCSGEEGEGACQSLVAVFPALQCAVWLGSNTSTPDLGFCLPMLEVLIEELQPTAMTQEAAGLWIAPSMAGDTVLDLYCFPSAGSSATEQYEGWHERLPSFIRVKAVQLPGRGSRQDEPHLRSLHEMADRAAEAIRCKLTEGIPFALFGHGMGGILAYEVAIRLKCKYNRLPIHVFVSGCAAPSMWDAALPSYGEGVRYSPWIFTLVVNNQDKEGKAEGGKAGPELSELRQQALLEQLQGCDKLPRHLRQPDKATPADIKTLMLDIAAEESYRPKRTGYMFPRFNPLRADNKSLGHPPSRTKDTESSSLLTCPLMVIHAVEDPYVTPELLDRWSKVTTKNVSMTEILGTHSFYEDRGSVQELSTVMSRALAKLLSKYAVMFI